MAKQSRIKSLSEQLHTNGHGSSPFHATPYQASESIHSNSALHHDLIQVRAYQLYEQRGGLALDNWLEAEQMVKNST